MSDAGSPEDSTRRRSFALPPIPVDARREEHASLDPANPDERGLLIRAAHPELEEALDADITVDVGGQEMTPRLHLAMHEVVANQLWDDHPPEVWETARRLQRAGYRHHEILHMLAGAIVPDLWRALREHREHDPDAHRAALAALPESWEAQRPGGPAAPVPRDHGEAQAKRRKTARAARRRNRRR